LSYEGAFAGTTAEAEGYRSRNARIS